VVKAVELNDKTDQELQDLLDERLRALRNFRIQLVTSSMENVRVVRSTKRDVARIRTIMRQRELAAHPEQAKPRGRKRG